MLVCCTALVLTLLIIRHRPVYIRVLLSGSYLVVLTLMRVLSYVQIINLQMNCIQPDLVRAEKIVILITLKIIKLHAVFRDVQR